MLLSGCYCLFDFVFLVPGYHKKTVFLLQENEELHVADNVDYF